MSEFQGKFWKIFKKKEEDNTQSHREQDLAHQKPPHPPEEDFLPDDVRNAHQQATERLREFEQRIAQEHETWSSELKSRDEERINLEARLEQLEKMAVLEKEKRDLELKKVQEEAARELNRLEKHLQAIHEQWAQESKENERLKEDLANKNLLDDTNMKVSLESPERHHQDELNTFTKKMKQLQKEVELHRSQWMDMIRKKDEENVTLRTKLSLREATLKEEWRERDRQQKKEQEASESRIAGKEQEWAKKKREFKQQSLRKDAELKAIRDQMEQRKLENRRRIESAGEEYQKELVSLQEKISLLQKQLLDEKETWDRMLHLREEEFNKLKMQRMLADAQEKADWDKRKEELADYARQCERRVKSLQRKLDEQNELFLQRLQKKDEEVEAQKIQASLQIQELSRERDKKRKELVLQKENLEKELSLLVEKIAQEKEFWENQIQSKDTETERFRTDIHTRMEQEQSMREQALSALHAQKASLEKELTTIQEQLRSEQHMHGMQLEEKQSAALQEQELLEREKNKLQQELAALNKELEHMNAPLLRKVDDLKQLLENERETGERNLSEKENWLDTCRKELLKQEEVSRVRVAGQVMRAEDDREKIEQRLHTVKHERETDEKRFQKEIKKHQEGTNRLKKEMESLAERGESEKDKLTQSNHAMRQNLESVVPELEKKLEDQRRYFTSNLQQKKAGINQLNNSIETRKKETAQQLHDLSEQWQKEKDNLLNESKHSEQEFRHERDENQKILIEQSRQLNGLIYENESLKKQYEYEFDALRSSHQSTLKPYLIQKEELEKIINVERSQWSAHVAEADQRIVELHKKIAELERKGKEEKKKAENYYLQAQEELKQTIADKKRMLKIQEEEVDRELSERTKHLQHVKRERDKQINDHQNALRQIRQKNAGEIQRLKEEIESFTQSLDLMQRQWPEVLKHKEVDVHALKEEMERVDQRIRQEEEKEALRLQEVRRNGQIEAQIIQAQIEAAQREIDDLIREKDEGLEKIKNESSEKIKELENSMRLEGKHFVEEKFKLQKAIEELQWKIRDHEEITTKQLENKNNEIKRLEVAISEKDMRWHERIKTLEDQYVQEKEALVFESNQLTEKLKNARSHLGDLVRQKEQEIQALISLHNDQMRKLNDELKAKKKGWHDIIEQLKHERRDCARYWEERTSRWEETLRAKDGERSDLRNQMMQWEEDFYKQEKKLSEEFQKEAAHLAESIKEKEREKALVEDEYRKQMDLKEEQVSTLKHKAQKEEGELQEEINRNENEYLIQNEELKNRIDHLHSIIAEAQQQSSQQLKQLEKEMDNQMLELSTMRVKADVELKKRGREHDKVKRKLQEKISELILHQERITQDLELQDRLKEEEIRSLNERLAMRNERLKTEWEHRKETLDEIKKRFELELAELEETYIHQAGDREELIRARKRAFSELSTHGACFPQVRENMIQEKSRTFETEEKRLTEEIEERKNEGEDKAEQQKDIVRKKQIEAELLQGEIKQRDEQISTEINISRNILHGVMEKALSIKDKFRKQFSPGFERDTSKEKARENLQRGSLYYQRGQYEKAIVEFAKAIEYNPGLWSALQYQGLCYERLGMVPDALAAAERALAIQPRNGDLQAWVKQLGEMK